MDNLSHTLVGAALGEAGLKRRTGLGIATLMIAANLPDLDVLAIPLGDSLAFRRGWTHGPLALVALPILLTGVMLLWGRVRSRRGARPPGAVPVRPWQLLLLATIGVLSHPFFDWLNSYGIRLLMPFSHEWFYGDAIFIIDPWIWAALGLGVYLSRRRDRHGTPAIRRPARMALGAVAAYIALMVAGSRSAERVAIREIEAQQRGPVHRLMAGPAPVNPLRRRLIYDTGDAYGFGSLAWMPRAEVTLDPELLPKRQDHPAVPQAMRHPSIEGFLYWSRFPYFWIDEHPDHFEVHVNDARFSREARSGWTARSVPVARGEVGENPGE
ncbi:metal-dependent hydrolase [soil metagenome]